MKKAFLVGLPLVAVLLLVGGRAVSKPEPEQQDSIHKHFWESFPRSGYRLGIVLSEGKRDADGVAIEKVVPDSPADKAGLKKGDVLVRIGGEKIQNAGDIRESLRNLESSQELEVEILRDGNPMTVRITPMKRDFLPFRMGARYLGVSMQNLDADLAAYFQVDPNAGILVTRIERDSPAEKAGMHSGDIITHIDGKKVTQAEDVRSILEDGDAETVEITVLRHGVEQKLIAKPEKREFFDHRNIPGMRELPRMLEDPEFNSEMEKLKNELRDLKDELQGLRKEELEKLREEIQSELKKEMEKLRKELEDKRNEL